MEATKKKNLRSGYTTGACATAAVQAAMITLLTGERVEETTIYIPAGEFVPFAIQYVDVSKNQVTTETIKDGGDDPDATHGAFIQATVHFTDSCSISIDGGRGVGRVTKSGLPIPVGEAAINPVPRQMIREVAQHLLETYKVTKGVHIVISVPDGEEIAKRTLNGRLGIIGGISILGTRGIVVPFSNEAYTASITLALQVARTGGCETVAITTGGRSEKYAMKQYDHLPEVAFVEMGDFVGYTLHECKKLGVKHVKLVGMMGKLSKVAQGKMMVHAHTESIDFSFLAQIAKESGASETLTKAISHANTASQVGEWMEREVGQRFFDLLCFYCCKKCMEEIDGGLHIETSVYTLNGQLLGRASIDD
ncbi:cobalt-precorrin-5B (C(1))-methyltransferase [Robertmurraya sp. P23]|uniref:cobalt-precorrin-5B (C(1))-methyltransferase n=1 Tax=Robertmurraya sp. P23 TaxID=3436931 RepID=UPI003D96BF58